MCKCAVLGKCAQVLEFISVAATVLYSAPCQLLLSFWSCTSKPTSSLPSHSYMQILNVCERTLRGSCAFAFLRPVFLRCCSKILRLMRSFSGISNRICRGGGGVFEYSYGLLRCSVSQRKDLVIRVMCRIWWPWRIGFQTWSQHGFIFGLRKYLSLWFVHHLWLTPGFM